MGCHCSLCCCLSRRYRLCLSTPTLLTTTKRQTHIRGLGLSRRCRFRHPRRPPRLAQGQTSTPLTTASPTWTCPLKPTPRPSMPKTATRTQQIMPTCPAATKPRLLHQLHAPPQLFPRAQPRFQRNQRTPPPRLCQSQRVLKPPCCPPTALKLCSNQPPDPASAGMGSACHKSRYLPLRLQPSLHQRRLQ